MARLVLAAPTAYVILDQQWKLAAILFAIAASTDFLDGYLARSLDQSSNFGGLFDHSTDAFFVTIGLACISLHQAVPALLPCLVALSFLQYMLDSKALTGQKLRTSLIGRANGISYFLFLGLTIAFQIPGITSVLFDHILLILAWILVASTLISMIDRGIAFLKIPK